MLDEYIETQKITYQILKNAINKNKYSHAYLFETNGNPDKFKIALAFAKVLLCPNKYSNNKKCVNCTQCFRIDKNEFTELKIINPEGLWIKKEQLKELQNEFKVKSLEADKKVYIITDANKLNESSANTLLKFLEEPADNIVAILLSDNIHQLLDTIVSRCQIVTLKNNKKKLIDESLEKTEAEVELIDKTIEFIYFLEKNGHRTIINTKKIFLNIFDDKDKLINFFDIAILFYKDVINCKIHTNLNYFDINKVIEIANNNKLDQLINKLKIIISLKDNIYVNANTNLLVDKLILEIGGVK